jgi:NADH-quinone oxidoreductase subunit M
MITALLILIPFAFGLLSYVLPQNKLAKTASVLSLIPFMLSIYSLKVVNTANDFLLNYKQDWISDLGIQFSVGQDGLSALLVFLTTLLTPLILWSSANKSYGENKNFVALVLFMQAALIGVFTSQDMFVFYLFWELALLPIYFISLIWGGENRKAVTFKFFLYTTVGSLFMLASILYIYTVSPVNTFNIIELYSTNLSYTEQVFVFFGFFLAFAIKMPIFPLHTWQPDTYVTAPTEGTMLLSGIMLKMGIYGALRLLLPLAPLASLYYGPIVVILSVIGIVYASIIALKQENFKRMVAYVSIAHVALMAAGLFTFSIESYQGIVIQMLAHGINVVGMFYIVDYVSSKCKTDAFNELGGLRNQAPLFATFFLIILMANVALPLTNGFVGEYLLIIGLFQYNFYLAGVAGLTIILGAAYMLNGYQKVVLGEPKAKFAHFTDLNANDYVVLLPIVFLIVFMGVCPKLFMDISEPSIKALLNVIQQGQLRN